MEASHVYLPKKFHLLSSERYNVFNINAYKSIYWWREDNKGTNHVQSANDE